MSNSVPEGWTSSLLAEFCDVVGGGTPDRSVREFWGGDIPWASPTEITSSFRKYISETKERITDKGLEKSSAKLHPPGTVLMTSRASIGFVAINTVPMATNQGFQSLRCKDGALADYLYQYITWLRPELEKMSAGSTFSEISSSSVKKLRVTLPPLPEQQKIAAILSSVDDVIEKTRAQIDKLKDLKIGMMQELLTKGIGPDGAPHTAFKDSPVGRIPEDWVVSSLSELTAKEAPICYGILMPGKGVLAGVPVIKVKDIRGGVIEESRLLLTSKEIDEQYARSRVAAGDILLTIRGTTGRVARVQPSLHGANITQDTARIRVLDQCVADYVFAYLQTPLAQNQIESHTIGQAVKGINLAEVRKLWVVVPSVKERQGITRALQSIDQRISYSAYRLGGLENLKKALMQDLLTGKVRVKVD